MQYLKYFLAGVFGLLLFSCQQNDLESVEIDLEVPTPTAQIGQVAWSYDIPHDFDNRVQPAIDGDWVYIQSDTSLAKVQMEDGKIKWQVGLGTGRSLAASKILQDKENLYLNHSEWVRAYSKRNGRMLWEAPLNPDLSLSIPMKQNGSHLFLGRRGEVLRIDKSSGQADLRIPMNRLLPEGNDQQIAFDLEITDQKLFVSTVIFPLKDQPPVKDGRIFAFNLQDGAYLWGYEAPRFIRSDSLAEGKNENAGVYEIGLHGNLLAAMTSKEVFVLDQSNGEEVWRTSFEDYTFLKSLTISPQGGIIVGARHPYPAPMICLDVRNGAILWETTLETTMLTPPSLEKSWVFASMGSLQMVDATTGELLWRGYPPEYTSNPKAIYLSPVASNKEKLVCVGSQKVIALYR